MSSSRPGAPRPKTRAGAKAARANREKTVKQRAKNAKGGRGRKWAKWLGLTALVGFLLVVIAFVVAGTWLVGRTGERELGIGLLAFGVVFMAGHLARDVLRKG
jgi:hypothetical protein